MNIDERWQKTLGDYIDTNNFRELLDKISADYSYKNTTVYPHHKDLFRAFNKTPLNKVKVVILGQDPYHNPGQAHGLCFSVPDGVQAPPSLRNIFKEIGADIYQCRQGSPGDMSTDLTRWARQGVFLLNTSLTVLKNQPASHSKIGWEEFTDHVIETISESQEHVVFMLWGAHAQSKTQLINTQKHLILKAPHPSPLSAYRGFFGCRHFSQANRYLKIHGSSAIKW